MPLEKSMGGRMVVGRWRKLMTVLFRMSFDAFGYIGMPSFLFLKKQG